MWYVIWVTTGQEDSCIRKIEKNCAESTYQRVISPKKKISKKVNGEWVTFTECFIKGYIFVETDDIDAFAYELEKIEGFSVILKSYRIYMPLQENECFLLQSLVADKDTIEESKGILEGKRVEILEGPLKGLEGMIKHINRHKRLAVLEVEMFGKKTNVRLALEVVGEKKG